MKDDQQILNLVSFSTVTTFVHGRLFSSVHPGASGSYMPSPLRDSHVYQADPFPAGVLAASISRSGAVDENYFVQDRDST
jgi:hypothetical protein